MYLSILTLHVTSICLVVGTLFVQSLIIIFRYRLENLEQKKGIEIIQKKVYFYIYYPILFISIISGLYLTLTLNLFNVEGQKWIYWKIFFLFILILFGYLNGRQINKKNLPKPFAMFVHIGIFCTSAIIIYLVKVKPF